MVARSCALLIFIALENIKAREDFQVLKKNFSSAPHWMSGGVCSGLGSRPRLGQGAQWCLWGAEVSLPGKAVLPAERGLLTEPQDRGRTWAPQDPTLHGTSWLGVSFWGFRVLGDVLSLCTRGVFLSCRFGVGNLPWVLSQVLVTSHVFSLLWVLVLLLTSHFWAGTVYSLFHS